MLGERRVLNFRTTGPLLAAAVALASILAGWSSVAAQSEESADSPLTLAFILFDSQQYRQQFDQQAFVEQAVAQGDFPLTQYSQGDATLQKSQVEQFITQGVDAVTLWPANPETACRLVEDMQGAGIKVVNYNFQIPNCASDYVLQRDNTLVGIQTAEAATQAVPTGKYIIVSGDQGTNVARENTEGYLSVLQPYIDSGDIEVVSQQWNAGWSSESALAQVEQALTANDNDIQAILANNDEMAMAALQAVKKQGLEGQVWISGQDADLAFVKEMLAGNVAYTSWTIFQDMGKAAAEASRALVTGSPLPDGTTDVQVGDVTVLGKIIDAFGVTPESLSEWLCTYKFYSIAKVYSDSGIPEDEWPTCA